MRLAPWLTSPLISVIAGVAQAFSIADPWSGQPHWWLQVLSLSVLIWQLILHDQHQISWRANDWSRARRHATWVYAGVRGWLFGLGWLSSTFWWLYISMHTYGGLSAPLAGLSVLALAGFLSIYYALAAAIFVTLLRNKVHSPSPWLTTLGFASIWTLAELLRGTLLTGFPWGAGGYAHVDGPLNFLARFVGVYGIGFVAAALGALLPMTPLIHWRSIRTLISTTLLLMFGLGLWGWRYCDLYACAHSSTPTPKPNPLTMDVALLQGNIAQDVKFVSGSGIVDALHWYGEQFNRASASLVVAPETALPLLPDQMPPGYWQALLARYARPDQAALLGVPLGNLQAGYTNSVVGLKAGQTAPYRYNKYHLVPFGEFIPPLFRWFVNLMNIPLGDFSRGDVAQPSFAWQGQRIAPNICYEDLFGEELSARFADASQAPTVLVNISNLGWFGDSIALDQHLAISRMRALEFERPILRATNTGVTAIINHLGVVTHQLPRFTRGVLLGQFEGRTALTPYARWVAALGLWPLWLLCALLAACLAYSPARRSN